MFSCVRPIKLHRWGKWTIVGGGKITSRGSYLMIMNGTPMDEHVVGTYIKQERVCADCGFTQHKIIKAKG